MEWYDLAGWIGTVTVLLCYAMSRRQHRPEVFDWANALMWLPVCLPAVYRGAYSSALVSVCFGIIGSWTLWRNR